MGRKAAAARDFAAQVTESGESVQVLLARGGKQVHQVTLTAQKRPRLLSDLDPAAWRQRLEEFLDRERHSNQSRYALLLSVQRDAENQFARQTYEVRRLIRKLVSLVDRQDAVTQLLLEEGRAPARNRDSAA